MENAICLLNDSFAPVIDGVANAVMNSGEAFVKAVSDTTRQDFGTLKICFDVSCVGIALVLSLLFFDFTIQGTREGTLIAALCTGMVIKFFTPRLRQPLERFIGCHRAQKEEISA